MLEAVKAASLDELVQQVIPDSIRLEQPLDLPPAETEHQYLTRLRGVAAKNRVFRSFIGLGYYDTITPAVILRNVMENPSWYTPYTPYQAEIAQGRLESLLNFQTMVRDLTSMEIANASLLDEATAAAEAMTMLHRVQGKKAGGSEHVPGVVGGVSTDAGGSPIARRAAWTEDRSRRRGACRIRGGPLRCCCCSIRTKPDR